MKLTTYTASMQILDIISSGSTVTAACDKVGISATAFRRCVNATPELQIAYDDAQQRGHDAMADSLLTLHDHPLYGSTDPRIMGVVSSNIKWLLSRRDSKRYGDRVAVEVNISTDRAITSALERARARATNPTLEGEVVAVESDEDIMSQLLG
ncbi:MAG: hypothetical protein KAR40_15475 [Candidatus Sabulitectum sp.]|nr:hypothetical protein [Candidatus Sabulitectum sp.]